MAVCSYHQPVQILYLHIYICLYLALALYMCSACSGVLCMVMEECSHTYVVVVMVMVFQCHSWKRIAVYQIVYIVLMLLQQKHASCANTSRNMHQLC